MSEGKADISFLNVARDYSNSSEKVFKAMIGLSPSGRYHYLDIAMSRFHSDMHYVDRVATSVILDVDLDTLLQKASPTEFFKYLNKVLYDSTMFVNSDKKSYPDSFDLNTFRPIFKYVYDKMENSNQEVLWSRLCTMLAVRGLYVTFGDSNRAVIYSIRLMKPKYIKSSLSDLAVSMYNWEPGVNVSDLVLEDMLIHPYSSSSDKGSVLMTIFMREFDMFNNIVYDPHLKAVEDIDDIKTSYDVMHMDFMQFIIGMGILKWDVDKPNDRDTFKNYIPEKTAEIYSMFMYQNTIMPDLDKVKRLPSIDSLLFERTGSYFFEEYEKQITTIKGWNNAYNVMKWMRIYSITTSICSIIGTIISIIKKKDKQKVPHENVEITTVDHSRSTTESKELHRGDV